MYEKKPNDTNMVKNVTYLYAFGQNGMSTHFTKVSLYANVIIILLLEVTESFWFSTFFIDEHCSSLFSPENTGMKCLLELSQFTNMSKSTVVLASATLRIHVLENCEVLLP
jgi:hypothetical protein